MGIGRAREAFGVAEALLDWWRRRRYSSSTGDVADANRAGTESGGARCGDGGDIDMTLLLSELSITSPSGSPSSPSVTLPDADSPCEVLY